MSAEAKTENDLVEELGGDTVILKAKDPKAVAAKIRRMKFATRIKAEGSIVQVTVADSHKNLPVLLKALSGIESIEIRPATLNEVFIKYTGKGIREDAAEGGFWDRMMNPNNR